MADHRIRRVQHLVGKQSRQAEDGIPERRRHHAIGEILGKAFDRRAADGRLVQSLGIAPDDAGNGGPPTGKPFVAQRNSDGRDVIGKALLRQEDRHQPGLQQDAGKAEEREEPVEHQACGHCQKKQRQDGGDAVHPALRACQA